MAVKKSFSGTFLLIAALGLLAFTVSKKKKGTVVVDTLKDANSYVGKGVAFYDENNVNQFINQASELLINILNNTGTDYYVTFIKPNGQVFYGFVSYNDVYYK